MVSASFNGLICFTNCLLPQEDGSLDEKDLWVDENQGLIVDAQVWYLYSAGNVLLRSKLIENILHPEAKTA
jgi:hypothetical protein